MQRFFFTKTAPRQNGAALKKVRTEADGSKTKSGPTRGGTLFSLKVWTNASCHIPRCLISHNKRIVPSIFGPPAKLWLLKRMAEWLRGERGTKKRGIIRQNVGEPESIVQEKVSKKTFRKERSRVFGTMLTSFTLPGWMSLHFGERKSNERKSLWRENVFWKGMLEFSAINQRKMQCHQRKSIPEAYFYQALGKDK